LTFGANRQILGAKGGPRLTRIRSGAALGVLDAVRAGGGSPERVLTAAGLSEADLAEPDRMVDLEAILRLQASAAREVGDESFGLHLGLGWDLGGGLGILSYAVLNAPTVATALQNFERYARAHIQGGGIALVREGGNALLVYQVGPVEPELARQHLEGAAVVGLRILRHLIGPDFRPTYVAFGHRAPPDPAEHARIFGAPVRFEQRYELALAFPAADLGRQVVGADRRLLPIVERHLDELLASHEQDTWLQRVRTRIAESLCDGAPDIGRVAKQLGMSVRTFQRRLDENGVVWKALVAEIRRDLARRYLADGSASLTEIAFLLGYSELSAFDRAFRRWTGSTPLAVRRSLRAAAG
jgi:AraC-like DNA-binding protein